MPKLLQKMGLFASPLLTFEIDDHERLNAQLLRDANAWRSTSIGFKASNQHGWHSEATLFERTEPSFRELCGEILRTTTEATHQISPNFEKADYVGIAEGWINISGQGAFNTPHDHPGFCWSGTYYVSVPESESPRGGAIEFLDPRTNVLSAAVPGSPMFQPKFRLKPKAGWLIIFPSYLRHWVYPNDSNEDRVSIAFNLIYRRKQKEAA